ncbi:hypothetical protein Acy02nite_47170 [Actinoplanes cyaneus]|uniref:Recombination endonuclease VII n=1 Tax=Actinoplanes cyaneus TaxID=52696 RepID=A0A919ILJ5_9ACTN|nr:endonuclease domain-containing protein [Actinoplanes cyaneus]GID66836.1 hypothetical protein Acy02nite_47170 [Actinoplanes cyaneus]
MSSRDRIDAARREGAALVWIPDKSDQTSGIAGDNYKAEFPEFDDPPRWLRRTCRVRHPIQLPDGRWELARHSLQNVVWASVDNFGAVLVIKDGKKLSKCGELCQTAEGPDCDCSCLGETHGQLGGQRWIPVTDFQVFERKEGKRSVRMHLPPGSWKEAAKPYTGELELIQYAIGLKARKNWPKANEFFCASCLIRRAHIWDHCHEHGFVRAPLCTPCNTWHWKGWRIPPREAAIVDTSYLRYCPEHRTRRCSP